MIEIRSMTATVFLVLAIGLVVCLIRNRKGTYVSEVTIHRGFGEVWSWISDPMKCAPDRSCHADRDRSRCGLRLMKGWRLVALASVGGLLFALSDFVFSWNPIAAAPYLAHRHEPVFRATPLLDAFGLIAETFNGWIAALAYLAMRPRGDFWWSRGARFGLCLWGFWVVSGSFSAFVWINLPTSVFLSNLAFGLPKCLAIGSGMAWFWNRCFET